ICYPCFDNWNQYARVALTGPCEGCNRPVNLTGKALKSWLAHGKRIYCCEDCSQRPPIERPTFTKTCEHCGKPFAPKRLDARFCGASFRAMEAKKIKAQNQ